MVVLFSHTNDVEAAGMSRQHHGKKTFATGPGTHTQYTHPDTGSLFFVCLPVLQQHAKMHPQQQLSPDIRNHQHCPSPTLLYNTLLQHSCSTFRQHSCPTHLDNTSLQHSPVQHVFTTRLPLTSLQPLLQHFSTTLFSTLLYNTLLQQTCLLTLLIKHNHKNTTISPQKHNNQKNNTTSSQKHQETMTKTTRKRKTTTKTQTYTNIQPTDKSDKNTTTLPLFLSTPNMLCVQFPRHSDDHATSSTAPSRNSANLVNSEIVLCTQFPRGTAMTLRKAVLCAYATQTTTKTLAKYCPCHEIGSQRDRSQNVNTS